MMNNYGIENGKFFIDIESISRPIGNFREENDRKAIDLATKHSNRNIVIGFTGGIDSQCIRRSFETQGISVDTAFLYMPGYNDSDYEQVQQCDKIYGKKTEIYDLDPESIKEELIEEANQLKVTNKFNLLQARFLKMLPDKTTLIQSIHDPYVHVRPDTYKPYYVQNYESAEIGRDRAYRTVTNRDLQYEFWGDTSEILLSILGDDVFKAAITAAKYFDNNGYTPPPRRDPKTLDRWDAYIKPVLYGRYYSNTELLFFSKRGGMEKIDYVYQNTANFQIQKQYVAIPYYELLDFMGTVGSNVRRYYENVNFDKVRSGEIRVK